jgi:hypothetical protein
VAVVSWVVVIEEEGTVPAALGPYRSEGRAFAALAFVEGKLPEDGRATIVPCLSADAWAGSSTGLSPTVEGAP